jgi:hypothetical protein
MQKNMTFDWFCSLVLIYLILIVILVRSWTYWTHRHGYSLPVAIICSLVLGLYAISAPEDYVGHSKIAASAMSKSLTPLPSTRTQWNKILALEEIDENLNSFVRLRWFVEHLFLFSVTPALFVLLFERRAQRVTVNKSES